MEALTDLELSNVVDVIHNSISVCFIHYLHVFLVQFGMIVEEHFARL